MATITRMLRRAGLVLLGLLLLCMAGWGVLALPFFDHESAALRSGLAAAFGILSLVAFAGFVMPRWRLRAVTAFLVLFAVVLWRWLAIEPSNERSWQPDVARLSYATVDGDRITVHNIRNFDYRSETDYTPAYYDKTFDLQKLESVDLVASYWMGPDIAHTFLSFGFAGGDQLAVSIETRKETGESYSTVRGFFRQYELYYVVADERDVIGVRTNYRKDPPEDVYVYRLQGSAENRRSIFLAYVGEINALKDRPDFYMRSTRVSISQMRCTWRAVRALPDSRPSTNDWRSGQSAWR